MGDSDVDYWPDTGVTFETSNNVAVGGYTCQNVRALFFSQKRFVASAMCAQNEDGSRTHSRITHNCAHVLPRTHAHAKPQGADRDGRHARVLRAGARMGRTRLRRGNLELADDTWQ